ncbi:hypothetical protein LTR78_007938 [Recurvomyces mirabilis]|uniref:DUF1750-domain-containing protein n=1 Tax=Recurvomyces mirabilis TaxID=574656 RepID=A0AAE0TTR9_9PEZI|nr:hypothetical protein LTR78_007938 [Recurvomyces mirabilis]KAK5152474.1 hypothetical protein LTS14_008421 [Recurvomyces mirabilis]
MQNPSQGVAPQLQPHVHLISNHRFPHIAALDLDHALKYLLDAPTIVKSIAPMSWTYIQAPQDGTIWLEWLPPNKGSDQFPSDGYVWGDHETTYRHDIHGYTIERMKHTIGHRMQYDQMASHARTRYHLIAKNPSVNAAPPDPALWIVHYHQAEQNRILPSSQVPFTPQMQKVMQERQWLENQGKLERKDFMLHDRPSWPMINVPSGATMQRQMAQPGFYGAGVQQNRYPQYYPQQAGAMSAQPAAKRQRPNPPVPGASGEVAMAHDMTIEDEENTTGGDFFDHITPREISMTRYMQHHRWMEEVFSSPYASSQIVPADLGMGLMGELKGLTDGILAPPKLDLIDSDLPPKPKEAAPFTNLSKDQLAEFDKRVAKHLEEGQAEIERMKAEHAEKMQEWKKSKTLMQAEKRLRYATWEGHENATSGFRLEENGGVAVEGAAEKETVEDIVREVEEVLGVKIAARKQVAEMVEKGGLEREEEVVLSEERMEVQGSMEEQQKGFMEDAKALQQQSRVGRGEIFHGEAPQMQQQQLSGMQQPQYPSMQAQQVQQQQQSDLQAQMAGTPTDNQASGMDSTNFADTSLLDDMEMSNTIDFGDDPDNENENENETTPFNSRTTATGSTSHQNPETIKGSTLPSATAPDRTGGLQPSTTSAPAGPTTATADEQNRGLAPGFHPSGGGSLGAAMAATATVPNASAMAVAGGTTTSDFDGSGMLGAEGTEGMGEDSQFEDNMFGDLTNDEEDEDGGQGGAADLGGDAGADFDFGGVGGDGEGEGDGDVGAEGLGDLMDDSAFGEATFGMDEDGGEEADEGTGGAAGLMGNLGAGADEEAAAERED